MIDRSFQYFAHMLRSSDLRVGDIRTELVHGPQPLSHPIDEPSRNVLIHARTGHFRLSREGAPTIILPQGATMGLDAPEGWTCRSNAADREDKVEAALFVSSIPRRFSMLQSQANRHILLPADAQPHADIVHHLINAQIAALDHPASDRELIVRRCVEACLIELVHYQRDSMVLRADGPATLAGDENLLRAWSAYFAEPDRKWTLQMLANVAGLSRTTFATRFRQLFGAAPQQTLTALRLEQAEAMLRNSTAPLIQIAINVGYNSEAAFVRAFRRQYGMPPGRYRTEQANGAGSD